MKKTAVQWFVGFLVIDITDPYYKTLFDKAIEMEKEQIMQAFANGKINGHKNWAHKYYNETYETKTN